MENKYFSEELANQTVVLDGGEFTNCNIHDCTLTFSGGALPKFVGNTITHNELRLVGAALNTMLWLSAAYNHLEAEEWVERIFEDVRQGPPGN